MSLLLAKLNETSGTEVAPGAGSLVVTGYAPSISQPQGVATSAGALAITGYPPTVVQGTAPAEFTEPIRGGDDSQEHQMDEAFQIALALIISGALECH